MLNLFEGSILKLLLGPMMNFISGLSWGGGDDEGGGGSGGGYDVVTMPQYDFTEPRYRMMNDFITQQMGTKAGADGTGGSGLANGEVPEWLRKMLYGGTTGQTPGTYAQGSVGYGLQRANENTAFGLPGQRYGTIPTALSAAAVTGAGAGPANRAVSRAGQVYAQQAQRIDEFISEQALTGSQNTLNTMFSGSASIPKGPDAQIVQYGAAPKASTDGMTGGLGGAVGSLLPSITGMFTGGSGTATTASGGNSNWLGGVSSLLGQGSNYSQPMASSSSYGGINSYLSGSSGGGTYSQPTLNYSNVYSQYGR